MPYDVYTVYHVECMIYCVYRAFYYSSQARDPSSFPPFPSILFSSSSPSFVSFPFKIVADISIYKVRYLWKNGPDFWGNPIWGIRIFGPSPSQIEGPGVKRWFSSCFGLFYQDMVSNTNLHVHSSSLWIELLLSVPSRFFILFPSLFQISLS